MGIFTWLDKQFPSADYSLPHPVKPAPKMPAVKPSKPSGISEPVISLIESLGKDEWELMKFQYCVGGSDVIQNVFYEHLTVHIMSSPARPFLDEDGSDALLGAEWMTEKEKLAVTQAALSRIRWLRDLAMHTRYARERNKFMVLVKDNQ